MRIMGIKERQERDREAVRRGILDAAREMKQHIIEELRACIDAGDLPHTADPHIAMRALMVGVLGVALLNLSERLLPGENADLLAADVLNLTLAGLRSGVTLQSPRGV